MKRAVFSCVTLLSLVASAHAGGDNIFSGPQPGEKVTPFKVHVYAGPGAGKEGQLLAEPKDTPRLLIFIHEITRPTFQLLRPLDLYASKLAKSGLETNIVWLTADKSKAMDFLDGASKSLSLKSPVVISLDGIEGPGNYGLNRKATITILVAKGDKVVANFAIVQPNETDTPKVVEALAKLMNQKAPTLAELQKELDKDKKGPDKKGLPPELQTLMRKMIQKDVDDTAAAKIAMEMREWAGDDQARQKQLRDYCQQVVGLGYGTEACKKALMKLAGK